MRERVEGNGHDWATECSKSFILDGCRKSCDKCKFVFFHIVTNLGEENFGRIWRNALKSVFTKIEKISDQFLMLLRIILFFSYLKFLLNKAFPQNL